MSISPVLDKKYGKPDGESPYRMSEAEIEALRAESREKRYKGEAGWEGLRKKADAKEAVLAGVKRFRSEQG